MTEGALWISGLLGGLVLVGVLSRFRRPRVYRIEGVHLALRFLNPDRRR